ncbi:TPA: aminotransferase class I/II-fold pyridoxal phosphate-dependent enzyme, partial [Candidatus Bathyarchaeota archaeon]|nr:aminotransferase class I/II-fold pyridoxal phosphate-dependent enzyme [Candidatus Bathyarchaeota archaeon]
ADESVVVVLDEAYAEFVDRPLTGLVKEYENLIAIRTFSKAFGLAGLRIGYALSHPSLAEMMERVIPPFPVNIMALVAASAALDDLEYVGKIRGLIAAGREYLRDGLSGIDGVTVYPSQTNFLLVKVDGAGSDGIARALARRGILVRDCSDERGLGPNFIRVTVGTMDENRRLVRAMREAMSEAIG